MQALWRRIVGSREDVPRLHALCGRGWGGRSLIGTNRRHRAEKAIEIFDIDGLFIRFDAVGPSSLSFSPNAVQLAGAIRKALQPWLD
jgi:hypothetical protein